MRSGTFPTPCLSPEPALFLRRGLLFAFLAAALKAQNLSDFQTPLPLKQGETLVIGIAGGWEPSDAPWTITRRIALHLDRQQFPNTYFETVENHHLDVAHELIQRAFDHDRDGKLNDEERKGARIILYGQSLGGSASVRLCRWLKKQSIPVRLNVQIDSVGLRDGKIPDNVMEAANLYQHDFGPIRGQSKIKPDDKSKTRILGNWRYRYPRTKIVDTSEWPLLHRLIVNPHLKMEFDPEVSQKVESLIASVLRNW